jgi:regulator of sigma E protease
MNVVLIIILFIVSLFVLISLHELGHFSTAKRAGIKVEEFGIGLPPRLFGIKRGETIYSANAIPFGAFVKMAGEDDPSVPRSLASKGPWTRLLVYAAGPLVNILLALILLSSFLMLPTKYVAGIGAMVHSVVAASPAAEAGIEPGDVILEVNDKPVRTWAELQNLVNATEGQEEITLLLKRDETQDEVGLEPVFDPTLERRTIGVLLCWNIVSQVDEGSPAHEAGFRPQDTILTINGQPVYNDESMSHALQSIKTGEEISVSLIRAEEETIIELDSIQQIEGINLHWVEGTRIEQERLPLWKAVHAAGSYIVYMPLLIVDAIPLLKEDPGQALIGPIGAGQLTIEYVESSGVSNILFMMSIISLGLALFNFLPIPPLDGGGMLVAFVEGIRRGKRLSTRAVKLAYTIGTILLITLMVGVTFNDILRLVGGEGFGL